MLGNIRRVVSAHILVVVTAVAFISFVGGVFYAYYSETEKTTADEPLPTPTFPPTPDAPIAPAPRPLARGEEAREADSLARYEDRNVFLAESGISTMGSIVEFTDDMFIQLPEDAYVKSIILVSICFEEDCIAPPVYVIVRGESEAYVKTNGYIWRMTVDENEPDTFDFLRDLDPDSYELLQANAGVSEDPE